MGFMDIKVIYSRRRYKLLFPKPGIQFYSIEKLIFTTEVIVFSSEELSFTP